MATKIKSSERYLADAKMGKSKQNKNNTYKSYLSNYQIIIGCNMVYTKIFMIVNI